MEGIKHIIFDVDGTLYRKDIEYNPKLGSIQTAHDFFRYVAHQMLKRGTAPEEVSASLVNEYKQRIQDGTLKERVTSIEVSDRKEWKRLVEEYGANGKVFDYYHGLKEKGFENFLHKMLSNIDFRRTLDRDQKLLETFDYLKHKGYNLGILTSEVYSTIEDVATAMGFDLADFYLGNNPTHLDLYSESDKMHYPIICRNNSIAKPNADGFEKVMRILSIEKPQTIVYVGDDKKKDVEPPLKCGWQAVHVLNDDSSTQSETIKINGEERSYTRIGDVYAMRELF